MDDVTAAKLIISCLDLTTLNTDDTEERVLDLCERASTPYGKTAAVCIWSRFLPFTKDKLPSEIKKATVINFPKGLPDILLMEQEIAKAIQLGADELDVVLPYRTLLSGDSEFCLKYLQAARKASQKHTLKIIIESGELKTVDNIRKASELCIEAEADFIKTSTGKTEISATPEAANIILETIKKSGKDIGFKASGGIKTTTDAKKYLSLAQSIMGSSWVSPKHFRIGASSVLTDLINTIERGY